MKLNRILLIGLTLFAASKSYAACVCTWQGEGGWEQIGECTPEQVHEGCYGGGGGGGGGGGSGGFDWPDVPIEEVDFFPFFHGLIKPRNLHSENRSSSCGRDAFGTVSSLR